MARPKSKRRRVSLQSLAVLPGAQRPREAHRTVAARDALVVVVFLLAGVALLRYGVLVDMVRGRATLASMESLAGTVMVLGTLAAVAMLYLCRFQPRLAGNWQRLAVFGSCCLACVLAAKALVALDGTIDPRWQSLAYLTPLSGLAILFTVVYGQRAAIAGTMMLALLVGLAVQTSAPNDWSTAQPLPVAIVLLCGGLAAVLASRKLRKRLKPLNVGLLVGLVHVVVLVGFLLLRGSLRLDEPPPGELLWGFANGFGVGVLITLSLPLIEILFNVCTDIRLLELSDQEQPLLRYLVALAPSTDNHSRRVALLAEAAAEAIEANSLFALVASYYHDIGKMVKPECFIENQSGGESPHDRLRPSMSALIIAAHTKDGVELAQEAGLPQAIIDVIAQHHGTSTIEFFYNRYLQEAGDKPALDADFFRYPGPKPATKEAAIVMLADAVEAASRTLAEPLPSRIETLIKRLTTAKLLDGQFEDCRLTLSELNLIEQSFFRVLCAMYHGRIDYPQGGLQRTLRTRGLRSIASAAIS